MGPTQDRVLALISALGMKTFPTFDDGNDVYVAGSTKLTYSDTGPLGTAPPDPTTAAETAAVVAQLDQMSTSACPLTRHGRHPNAAQWESYTLDRWVKENSASPGFQALVPARHAADLRSGAPRALAAVHALLHRVLGR